MANDWSAYSKVTASVRDVYEMGDAVVELKDRVEAVEAAGGGTVTNPDGTTVMPSTIDFAATVVD